jgi:hypothetical protein
MASTLQDIVVNSTTWHHAATQAKANATADFIKSALLR